MAAKNAKITKEVKKVEEVKATAVKAEPVKKVDTVKAEPAKVEPAKAEPAKAEKKVEEKKPVEKKPAEKKAAAKKPASTKPKGPPKSIEEAIARGEFDFAAKEINAILKINPKDVKALNLKAAMECAQKEFSDAERTLDVAISSNPQSYHSYYNMARLKLMANPPDPDGARRYYKTGRAYGGAENKWIEERIK